MLRYCTTCEKEYDFDPLLVSGEAPLICPECGMEVPKNSRKPVDYTETKKMEENIGRGIGKLMHLSYIFFALVSAIGIAGYILNLENVVFICTGINLIIFLVQVLTGHVRFRLGIVFLPAGALAGYFLLNQRIMDACLGVMVVFLVRFFVKEVVIRLFWKLVRVGNER